jgi:hypothetical protein
MESFTLNGKEINQSNWEEQVEDIVTKSFSLSPTTKHHAVKCSRLKFQVDILEEALQKLKESVRKVDPFERCRDGSWKSSKPNPLDKINMATASQDEVLKGVHEFVQGDLETREDDGNVRATVIRLEMEITKALKEYGKAMDEGVAYKEDKEAKTNGWWRTIGRDAWQREWKRRLSTDLAKCVYRKKPERPGGMSTPAIKTSTNNA